MLVEEANWKFIWKNELKQKRLQKNLGLGEASCGMKNRGETNRHLVFTKSELYV